MSPEINDSSQKADSDRKWDLPIPISVHGKPLSLCFCHRKIDRSFSIWGYTMPLCARCTGILMGFYMGLVLEILAVSFSILLSMLFLLPLIVDGVTQMIHLRKSNNLLRFATGFLFGIGYLYLLFAFFRVVL